MSTIHQVDPIALRKKLRKLGIGPGFQFSQSAAEDAVRDCRNAHAQEAEVHAEDTETYVQARGDVEATCPKCAHEFTIEDVEIEDECAEVPADVVADAVEIIPGGNTIGPGSCVLEPAELAYMIHNWALLWEMPA